MFTTLPSRVAFLSHGFVAKASASTPHVTQEILARPIIIIIKLYCHIQRALHDELECSLALNHNYSAYIYNKIKYGK